MKHIGIVLLLSALFFSSCCNDKQRCKESTCEIAGSKDYALIGKRGLTTFPKMTVETTYISSSRMHWKTTDIKGVVAEGDEEISYEKLTDHLHFLNWIEKNGYVISLVINTKDGKVKAFWSSNDEHARGKRSSTFTEGKFKFLK